MVSECMECVEGRAVALGLCSHCLAGEPVEAVVGQIARLTRELEEARERERLLREALEPFAYLDYDIGDEWRDDCERARRALATDMEGGEADRVCDPCFAHRALTARRGEGGGE